MRYFLRFCLLPLALACPAVPAAGQDATRSQLSAVEVFDLAHRAAEAGRVDEALTLYDALSRDPDIEIRSEARFRKANLLAAQRRFREAAQTYRQLLDEKPGAARVRLELAAILARLGDEPGARREIRLAQATGLPPEVAEQVSQFSQALRSPKNLGGSLEFALAPDTNVNRGTQARTLDTIIAPLELSEDARETSGVGVRLRSYGFFKQPLVDRIALVARATGSADLYRGGSTNDVLASGQLGAEWRGAGDQASLAYSFTRRWYGGERYADRRSVTGEWLHQLDRVTQLSSSFSWGAIGYRANRLQNGHIYDGNFSVERALSARSGVGLGLGLTRQGALDPSYASWSGGPSLYGWRDLGRTTIFAAAAGRRLVGDERNFLFIDKRREWFVSARAGAVFRRYSVHGFAPTVRINYERNMSTVSIYDYRRVYGEFGLTRSF